MLSKEFTINCKEGFHLRPAQVLMEAAASFKSDIILRKTADEEVDAKSILGLMTLGLEEGQSVTVEVNGPDENEAMNALEELFNNNFGE